MTSHYNTSSWRDDFDLEPNVSPTIAYALLAMRGQQATEARVARDGHAWPFPAQPIPLDGKAAPRHPDAEDAPI